MIVLIVRVQRLEASALTTAANSAGDASAAAPSDRCRLRVVLYAKCASASGVGCSLEVVSAERSGKKAEAGGDGLRGCGYPVPVGERCPLWR
jgi:hypothetical protein